MASNELSRFQKAILKDFESKNPTQQELESFKQKQADKMKEFEELEKTFGEQREGLYRNSIDDPSYREQSKQLLIEQRKSRQEFLKDEMQEFKKITNERVKEFNDSARQENKLSNEKASTKEKKKSPNEIERERIENNLARLEKSIQENRLSSDQNLPRARTQPEGDVDKKRIENNLKQLSQSVKQIMSEQKLPNINQLNLKGDEEKSKLNVKHINYLSHQEVTKRLEDRLGKRITNEINQKVDEAIKAQHKGDARDGIKSSYMNAVENLIISKELGSQIKKMREVEMERYLETLSPEEKENFKQEVKADMEQSINAQEAGTKKTEEELARENMEQTAKAIFNDTYKNEKGEDVKLQDLINKSKDSFESRVAKRRELQKQDEPTNPKTPGR